MKKVSYLLLFASLGLQVSRPAHGISQQTATIGTVLTTAGVAGGAFYLMRNRPEAPYNYLAIAGVSALTGWIAWKAFYSFTPQGRLESAQSKLAAITGNPMSLQAFTDDRMFFEALQEVYISEDFYLVKASVELAAHLDSSRLALELLDKARAEAAQSNLANIVQGCNDAIPLVRRAIANLTAGLKRIRTNPDFMQQKKLQVQQQAANAQTQMANAQMHQAFRY